MLYENAVGKKKPKKLKISKYMSEIYCASITSRALVTRAWILSIPHTRLPKDTRHRRYQDTLSVSRLPQANDWDIRDRSWMSGGNSGVAQVGYTKVQTESALASHQHVHAHTVQSQRAQANTTPTMMPVSKYCHTGVTRTWCLVLRATQWWQP